MVCITNLFNSNIIRAHARVHVVLDCSSIALLVAHGAIWVEEGTHGKQTSDEHVASWVDGTYCTHTHINMIYDHDLFFNLCTTFIRKDHICTDGRITKAS